MDTQEIKVEVDFNQKGVSVLDAQRAFVINLAQQVFKLSGEHCIAEVIRADKPELFIDPTQSGLKQICDCTDGLVRFMSSKNNFYRNFIKKVKKNQFDSDDEDKKQKCAELLELSKTQDYQQMNGEFDIYEDILKAISKVTKSCLSVYTMLEGVEAADSTIIQNLSALNAKIANGVQAVHTYVNKSMAAYPSEKRFVEVLVPTVKHNIDILTDGYQAIIDSSLQNQTKAASQKPATVISAAEQERLACIKKANDAYKRLTDDLLVDVKKQYAATTIKQYHDLMNAVDEFEAEYKLPLAQNTSIGAAKNALYRINDFAEVLQDCVSELASKSYQTGGFVR